MPDLEHLLREGLQHEAQRAQPDLLRRLQVPTRRPSWRPRLLPLAAAAAVIAVITAGALVAGLTAAHKPAAHKPAVSGSAPAGLPRFYVTTSSLDAWLRPSSTSQPKTRTMIRYSSRTHMNRDPAATCPSGQTAAH